MSRPTISVPTVAFVPSEKIKIIVVPSGVTMEERISVLGAVISTLGKGVPDYRAVVEIVYNLFLVGIPEMKAISGSLKSITCEEIRPTKADLLKWVGLEQGDRSTEGDKLPTLPGVVTDEAYAVTKMEAVYVALASLLFCLGKQASESARASVLDNRPDALIRRFGILEEDQVLLPGKSAGPSREFLEAIYNSFSNYTEIRTVIVTFFIGVKRGGQHLPIPLEIMMNNFQLMRGAGMTHVEAVMRLVKMHPWTLRVPELQSYFHKFAEDLAKFEEVDEDIRPYHRLVVPQSAYLFLSSDLRPLVAVAGSFMEEIERTFSGYVYNKANYQVLIDKVQSRAPNYHPTTGLSRLATMMGVTEVELPAQHGKQPVEEEDTV